MGSRPWIVVGRLRVRRLVAIVLSVAAFTGTVIASGQVSYTQDEQIPDAESLSLPTKDGLDLRCTYYGGIYKKTTIPIIIVHEKDGRRTHMHQLAHELQHAQADGCGFAVIVPDLRGHGESTLFANGKTIKADKLKPVHFLAMLEDLETAKKFLMQKNNEGELNIEQLCIIGVGEMGSMIAWLYANKDWDFPPLPGVGKQGQDVKALIMISPKISFKGMTLRTEGAGAHPMVVSSLSTMIIRGQKDSDAQKWHDMLKPKHKPLPKTEEEQARSQDLFLVDVDASVSGPRLLEQGRGLNVNRSIGQFLQLRLVNKKDQLRWQDRSKKTD